MTSPGIAIIGCGMIGETHAECLSVLGIQPVVFYDVDAERAATLAARFNALTARTAEEAIRHRAVDAVYICTHHDSHAMLATRAAEAGKHIFLEKPMALNARDCEAIVAAVESARVRCMTGFKMRFYPLVTRTRELIPNPIFLTGHILDNRWPDDIWANDPKLGGGNALSQGCHAMDLVCHLAQSKPVRIYAEGGNLHHPALELTDAIVATITFESGAIASVAIGDVGEPGLTGKLSFQSMDGARSAHLHTRLKALSYSNGSEVFTYYEDKELGFLEENREFLAALRDDRQPVANHRDGMRATVMVLEAIESARTGLPRTLPNF